MKEVLEAIATSPLPTILGLGGIIFLFLAFIGRVGGRVTIDIPQGRRKGFMATGAALLLGGTLLYALPFLLPSPAPVPTLALTATSTHTPEPTDTPTATPVSAPTRAHIPPLAWSTYSDDKGSSITIRPVQGNDDAVEVSFDVKADGWVGLLADFDPALFYGTRGIRFFRKGSGARNTIELKLLYVPDANGESAVFSVLWPKATVADDWAPLEAPYGDFMCWRDTPCPQDGRLDLDRVWRVDLAISSKPGDTPGTGVVTIDDIQGIK